MAMNIIEQGEIWAGASLIHYMLSNNSIDRNESSSIDEEQSFYQLLTPREQEIAQKILTGLQNKLIADELDITERTVKAHLSTIYKKLEVRNRLELTLKLQNTNRRTPS
ncbi:MAG: response regulator transcription factor [Gammaproteobacteria bacterium]|nr:response regulator transcription factor [Gammaproteobacteria bacterium]